MLSQKEEVSDTGGMRTKLAMPTSTSTEINVYVNPNEKTSDGSSLEEAKEASKNSGAPVKRSAFKANTNSLFLEGLTFPPHVFSMI